MIGYSSSWSIFEIGDKNICLEIQSGFACGQKDIDGGTPHLRMNNISSDGNTDFSLVRRIPNSIAAQKKRWLQPGDILFCNTNSTKLVGKTCIFTGWNEPCAFSNHLTKLCVNPKKVSSEWLCFYLRNLWINRYFAINCTEFIGQSAFNKNKLEKIEIPVPPLNEQRRIVERIEELTHRAEEVRKLRQDAGNEIQTTLQSAIEHMVNKLNFQTSMPL